MTKQRHKSALNLALDQLEDIIKRMKSEQDSPTRREFDFANAGQEPFRLFSRDKLGTVILSGHDAEEYSDCLIDLHHAAAGADEHISLRTVESAVQETVLKSLDLTNENPETDFSTRLSSSISALRTALRRQAVEWRIHLEIAGLANVGLPATVGDTEIYVLDSLKATEFEQRFASIISATRNASEQKEQLKQIMARALSEKMRDKTYAAVRVWAADKYAAEALALKRLRQTLDLINFFVPATGMRVYLPWEAKPHQSYSIAVSDAAERSLVDTSWHGPVQPFSFGQLGQNKRRTAWFNRASEILAKSSPSPLEDRWLSALQWAGRASIDERIEESFLLFAVSLESLLLDNKDNQQITNKFAVRGAHLVGRNLTSRKEICREFKRLYGIRSKIVHSGNTEVTDADRDTIHYFARAAIYAVLMTKPFSEMTTIEQLDEWFQDQIFGPDVAA